MNKVVKRLSFDILINENDKYNYLDDVKEYMVDILQVDKVLGLYENYVTDTYKKDDLK